MPSHARSLPIASAYSSRERSASVSSKRRMKRPPFLRAKRALSRAVRALPMWMRPVGEGANRYQFVNAQDLASACLCALNYDQPDLFHIGADNVKSLRAVYEAVIAEAASRSRVRSLPKAPTLALMRLAHKLNVSPLGPYHYRMIAEDFMFDTGKIKRKLGWQPTLTNEQMLLRAYDDYSANRAEIEARTDVSAHRKPAAMGVIRLLKWIS